ncbi:hypothetical protein IGI96_002998 [Enterococcus sp. DIV0421]|uniref:hypothetical protein n=1 Tax=Enterococcus sp. DIV0421 TaxID=2774688 RepID=UPI003F22B02B
MPSNKKIKKKEQEKLKMLRMLCEKQPELLIIQLAELIEETLEKTFIWIKVYELPYHWKLLPRGKSE